MVLVPGGGYDYQLSTDDNNELFSKRKTIKYFLVLHPPLEDN